MRSNRTGLRLGWLLALGVSCAAFARTAPASAEEVKITAEARQHFSAGVALLKDPDGARYEEAYGEFKAAYAASPSWKILGNLGIAAMKLERDGEAIVAFEKYLEGGKKELDAAERADVERDLNTLRSAGVQVTITTVPAAAAINDERTPAQGGLVRNRYRTETGSLQIRVRPGHHTYTASAPNKPAQTWEVDLEPGSSVSHAFDLDRPVAVAAPVSVAPLAAPAESTAPTSRPVPTSVYVGLVATGAFAIGAGVTGGLALKKNSDYEAANGQDEAQAKSLRDSTKTLNLVTDVLIGATLVSAGVTTYLYLKRPEQPSLQTTSGGLRQLRLAPQIGMNRSGLVLEGAF
jgi:hypothetical protein